MYQSNITMEQVRVREVLRSLSAKEKTSLKKLLPKGLEVPEVKKEGKYPNALLQILKVAERYSYLGCIGESMLGNEEISYKELEETINSYHLLTEADKNKLKKSKTTEEFLENLKNTKQKMDEIKEGTYELQAEVGKGPVVGHPDFRTETQIFEVKVTGQLEKNWLDFLFQTFAYGSLDEKVKEVCIVLPLQETVWRYNVENWSKRKEYRKFLEDKAGKRESEATILMMALLLMNKYNIGSHIGKQKLLHNTIDTFPFYERPYQIFLSGPQNSKINIGEEDLLLTKTKIETTKAKLYIHSPYIINLCEEPGNKDDYQVKLLIKNLEYGVKIGAKGVVVHVGKSCGREEEDALKNMYENISRVLESATEECPLLLETPAGQGTELLTKFEEFQEFISIVEDKRLGICVDTCHVYASGQDPKEYLEKLKEKGEKVRLVHYNDSEGCCGSCVDRHAVPGGGKIGYEKMEEIGRFCQQEEIDMLYE